jgi:hypothetical protein
MKMMGEKMNNKKGDVPVTILVLGVFVICGIAIGSFVYSSFLMGKSFEGLDIMENANINIEQNSLNYYYDQVNKTKFSINLDFEFFKEVPSFSVEYFKGG